MNVLVILSLWMTASIASPPPLQPAVLEVGSPIDRSIASGESETFAVRLDAGQAALIEIEGHEIGVSVKVTEPNGDTIAEVSESVRRAGPRRDDRGGRDGRHVCVDRLGAALADRVGLVHASVDGRATVDGQ